jgi:Xaa-Pro dipeptidase
MRPGKTADDLYQVHVDVFNKHGFGHAILSSCGYTMGATWPPTWAEMPMISKGNLLVLELNMTFFIHMILVDHEAGLTMSLGEQAIIHEDGLEVVTHVPHELIVH